MQDKTYLKEEDPDVYESLMSERERQKNGVELIPSENYVSGAVLDALGSVFTNKYSEGYPGRRYYGGNTNTDVIENLAIERAKALFNCDHANVQALSGSPMNQAVYLGWMKPGDTILGMDLSHGGHLTHGHPVSHMGKLFNFVRYKTQPDNKGFIDPDMLMSLAKEHKPKIILCGYTSYPRDLDYKAFQDAANEVGAVTMADVSHYGGLIAGKALRNPFDAGFNIVTTTTHKTLRGPRGGMILTRGTVSNPMKKPEHTVDNIPTIMDRSVFPGLQGGPHMNQVAAVAVALKEAATPEFETYAANVIKNAKALAETLMGEGMKLVTDGTDNHMMVIDCVKSFGISGAEVEKVLDRVHITTNKNPIPDDTAPPFSPSGLRLGAPAATTRGMNEDDMKKLGGWIARAIKARDDAGELEKLRGEIETFCQTFPVPGLK